MEQVEIFNRFLKIVSTHNEVEKSRKGFKSGPFEYLSNSNVIIFKNKEVIIEDGGYKDDVAIHQFHVKEDMGSIYIEDEKHKKVLVLVSDHDILKVGGRSSKLRQKHFSSALF